MNVNKLIIQPVGKDWKQIQSWFIQSAESIKKD